MSYIATRQKKKQKFFRATWSYIASRQKNRQTNVFWSYIATRQKNVFLSHIELYCHTTKNVFLSQSATVIRERPSQVLIFFFFLPRSCHLPNQSCHFLFFFSEIMSPPLLFYVSPLPFAPRYRWVQCNIVVTTKFLFFLEN